MKEYNEILQSIAAARNIEVEEAERIVNGFIKQLRDSCKDLDAVAIPGFGTFQPVKTLEHVVVDESTGKRTLMPPSVDVTFKSSVVLRKKLLG